jgi:hypothetical protein
MATSGFRLGCESEDRLGRVGGQWRSFIGRFPAVNFYRTLLALDIFSHPDNPSEFAARAQALSSIVWVCGGVIIPALHLVLSHLLATLDRLGEIGAEHRLIIGVPRSRFGDVHPDVNCLYQSVRDGCHRQNPSLGSVRALENASRCA